MKFTLLLPLVLVVSACHGCDEPTSGPDAGAKPDAARPSKTVTLGDLRVTERLPFTINSAKFLDAEEKTALFCGQSIGPNVIGILDLAALSVSKKIDMKDTSGADCHLSLIGGVAYAFFESDGVDTPGQVVKLSLPDLAVLALWPFTAKIATSFDFEADSQGYEGVMPTADSKKMVLSMESTEDASSFEVTVLDVETGEFTLRPIPGTPAVRGGNVYRSLGAERFLGSMTTQDPWETYLFAVNLDGSDFVRFPRELDPFSFDVEPVTNRLVGGGELGWVVYDLRTGVQRKRFPYINSGFIPLVRWLTPDCVVHVDTGSFRSYLTVMDAETGAFLAAATFPDESNMYDLLLTKDRRRLYALGSHIIEIPIEVK